MASEFDISRIEVEVTDFLIEKFGDLAHGANNCHSVSLLVVGAWAELGLPEPPRTRVARGAGEGIGGQHSWVVVGDPYAPDLLIDPTRTSTISDKPRVEVVERPGTEEWIPHGAGDIFRWGRPPGATGERIELDPPEGGWSGQARMFLDLLGPLDFDGWKMLVHAPMGGWPSREIITQANQHPRLRSHIPIDIVGMVTDTNPNGLYW